MQLNESSRQADLSFLSNPVNVYFIRVKAVLGEDESTFSPKNGIEFTYFSSALDGEKCKYVQEVTKTPEQLRDFVLKGPGCWGLFFFFFPQCD